MVFDIPKLSRGAEVSFTFELQHSLSLKKRNSLLVVFALIRNPAKVTHAIGRVASLNFLCYLYWQCFFLHGSVD